MLPELEPERDAAERVKHAAPILVIIGNPPYNAFAGASPAKEEGLVEPYKQGLQRDWGIRKFNLDELYVRFLRVAYHTTVRPIWNEPRPEFAAQMREGNLFIVSRMMAERPQEGIPIVATRTVADYHLLRPNIRAIPVRLFSSDGPQSDMLRACHKINAGFGG